MDVWKREQEIVRSIYLSATSSQKNIAMKAMYEILTAPNTQNYESPYQWKDFDKRQFVRRILGDVSKKKVEDVARAISRNTTGTNAKKKDGSPSQKYLRIKSAIRERLEQQLPHYFQN